MLVAVALVVLMMSLFAQVFSMATGAMSKQKGLAENDQRARLATTIIQGDLQKRTYRWMVAQYPGFNPLRADQQGYFYISDNDPTDDGDDVLQFTIFTSNQQKNKDDSPLYGHATPLVDSDPNQVDSDNDGTVEDFEIENYVLNHPNQPEMDDGQSGINFTGFSRVGEVAYWVRNGILYRRVMLVREPFAGNEPTPTNSVQPPENLIDAAYAPNGPPAYAPRSAQDASGASGIFWRDFDYSAVNLLVYQGSNTDIPIFLGATVGSGNALDNSLQSTPPIDQPLRKLGMPNMRWGFDISIVNGRKGRPREYVDQFVDPITGNIQSGDSFIGRYTHEETSHVNFDYPGQYTAATYPMVTTGKTLGTNGVVTNYEGGTRRGEDILLTNVQAFDIKVYDDYDNPDPNPPNDEKDVLDYRDVGYGYGAQASKNGFYNHTKNRQKDYGPRSATQGADGDDGDAGVDDDGINGTDDPGELGWPGTDDTASHVFDTWHPNFDANFDTLVDSRDAPPYRPATRGADTQPGVAGVDDDGFNGTDDDGELGYPGSDDVVLPMRSIQIKIRYLDPVSNQMRDLTIVQSLLD